MQNRAVAPPMLDAYQLRLPIFEGPLDVLLRLIEREQLPINEVSLLTVLDQFMDFVRDLESPAPEVIAEFASVAGRLSVLKSRALLPQPPKSTEEATEPDLVRQLEEYRTLKMAAELLATRHRAGAGGFGRGEAVAAPEAEPPRLTPQPPIALAKAVERWLARLPSQPVQVAARRIVTLREMVSRIFSTLDGKNSVTFASVRAGCHSRQEVAVAFLAMLTLLRRQAIVATQPDLFGTITLARPDAQIPMRAPLELVIAGSADGSRELQQ
jgi:segregation and condensation protein A